MLFVATASASAATIVVQIDWSRGGGTGAGSDVWLKQDGTDTDVYFAGVIQIDVMDAGVSVTRDALCVDLFTDIYIGSTYDTYAYNPDEIPGKNLPRVAWLVDNALPVNAAQQAASQLASNDWVTTPIQGIGLQMAVWDIVHDNGDGLFAGRVQASANGDVTDHTSDPTGATWTYYDWERFYLTSSLGQSSNSAYVYDNYTSDGTQMQMLISPRYMDGGLVPNPEPGTLLLVGLSLIAVGYYSRKKTMGRSR